MRRYFRIDASGTVSPVWGGEGISVPSTIVQAQYSRGNVNGTIALGTTPTVGNVMVLLMGGAHDAADPPTGWTRMSYTDNGSNGGTQFQKMWSALRPVRTGETGSTSYTCTDWTNLALLELDAVHFYKGAFAGLATSGSNFSGFTLRPNFGDALTLLFAEHDLVPTLAVTNGFSTLHAYSGPGGSDNHSAVLVEATPDFAGVITGTSSSTFFNPMIGVFHFGMGSLWSS